MTDAPDEYTEAPNSTVDDWHGQEVERDVEAAERALAEAGGDEDRAEELFEKERPEHRSDRFDVDPTERSGTLTTEASDEGRS